MAKILRTEQLSVDGDNIRLTATDGNLIINSVSGDDLTMITSTTKIGEDISSLAVRDTGFDADVSSLAANTSSVESMLVNVSKYGVYSLETSNLNTGMGSGVQTITLAGRAFVAKPTVTATLTGGSNDPIIAVMISDVSETATTGVYQVTFQFSDELPATGETDQSTNYKLNILANVNAADQDLDTIVDYVDSDRDGDGVQNSLDYNPDDSSVGKIVSVNFDGVDDYIELSSSSNYAFGTNNFTIEAWVKCDNSDYFTILQNLEFDATASSTDYFLGINTQGSIAFNMHGSNTSDRLFSSNSTFQYDGEFHHIAFTRTSDGCNIWYDGQSVATGSAFNTWNFNKVQKHTIGYRVTPNFGSGSIYGLRILNGTALYNTSFSPTFTNTTQLIDNTVFLSFLNDELVDYSTTDNQISQSGGVSFEIVV